MPSSYLSGEFRQSVVYELLSPKMHVMEVTLWQEEKDKISSHSSYNFEHGIRLLDYFCLFELSYCVHVEGTLGVPVYWSLRKLPQLSLGAFRSHFMLLEEKQYKNKILREIK
jgi:hypothetical protein